MGKGQKPSNSESVFHVRCVCRAISSEGNCAQCVWACCNSRSSNPPLHPLTNTFRNIHLVLSNNNVKHKTNAILKHLLSWKWESPQRIMRGHRHTIIWCTPLLTLCRPSGLPSTDREACFDGSTFRSTLLPAPLPPSTVNFSQPTPVNTAATQCLFKTIICLTKHRATRCSG